MFPDVGTHRRFLVWMLPLPPLQVVQVAAKRDGCALHGGDGDAVIDGYPTLAAHAALNELWRNEPMPGNAPVAILINAGGIYRANRFAGVGVPVLAVSPMVGHHGHAANFAERGLALIRGRVSPNAAIAAIEATGAAIVRTTVWHWRAPWQADAPALYQKFDCSGNLSAYNLLPRDQICYTAEKKYVFCASCRSTLFRNILKVLWPELRLGKKVSRAPWRSGFTRTAMP